MSLISNYVFEADAVRQRTVSCGVRAPRGSTQRYAETKHERNPSHWVPTGIVLEKSVN